METIFNITEKIEAKEYPYGRLRTSAFFSIEFDAKKGFRSVFQTINPKTGRLNKEKKSTYSRLMVMYREIDTNHVKFSHLSIRELKDVNKVLEFLIKNQPTLQLTDEMLTYIFDTMIIVIRISACYIDVRDQKELLEVLGVSLSALIDLANGGEKNLTMQDAFIPLEKIKQLEHEYKLKNSK